MVKHQEQKHGRTTRTDDRYRLTVPKSSPRTFLLRTIPTKPQQRVGLNAEILVFNDLSCSRRDSAICCHGALYLNGAMVLVDHGHFYTVWFLLWISLWGLTELTPMPIKSRSWRQMTATTKDSVFCHCRAMGRSGGHDLRGHAGVTGPGSIFSVPSHQCCFTCMPSG